VRFVDGMKKFYLLQVFFVLRKKQNQVTFLHVYHHTITALFSWGYLKYLPGKHSAHSHETLQFRRAIHATYTHLTYEIMFFYCYYLFRCRLCHIQDDLHINLKRTDKQYVRIAIHSTLQHKSRNVLVDTSCMSVVKNTN